MKKALFIIIPLVLLLAVIMAEARLPAKKRQ